MKQIKLYIEHTGEEYTILDRIPYVNSITAEHATTCQSVRKNPKDHFGLGIGYDGVFQTITSIPIKEKFYYPIVYSTTTLIDLKEKITLPDEIVKCITKGQCKILIVGPYEGWRPGFYTPIIVTLVKKYQITAADFVIISANSFPLSAYRTVYLNFWEINSDWRFNDIMRAEGLEVLEKNLDKDYSYICLNRRPHCHRIALVTELFNYQSNGLLSFQKITDNGAMGDYYGWQKSKFQKHYPNIYQKFLDQSIEEQLPINLPKDLDPYNMLCTNPTTDIYSKKFYNSYLHVVTETFAVNENEQIFFSEKIFKPMMYFQPFIVIGQTHTLKYLKLAGYKTFSQWIDESYDEEENNELRLQKAIKSVIDFISKPNINNIIKEMSHVLLHNAHWLKVRGKSQVIKLHMDLWENLNEKT